MLEWHKSEIADISLEFGTDVNSGRINMNSKRKRKPNNDIFRISSVDSAKIVRSIASDASLILLTTTYIIAALLGHYIEALVAIPVIFAAFSFACYIRYRYENQIHNSYTMLIPEAHVIENGHKLSLNALDVEIGDLIFFTKGDIIPADARLTSSEGLVIAERSYNKQSNKAEYHQVNKNHELIYADDNAAGAYDNMVYAGSVVVAGNGRGIVTAIGADSRVSKRHNNIRLTLDNDSPAYLRSFQVYCKRFSLAVLLSIIPVSLITIFSATRGNDNGEATGILYTFLIFLAISVISMGSLISSPSYSIVSRTLFPKRKAIDNGITRLSASEKISNTDTLLILCPEAVVDKSYFVRRIFYSDNEYRFESLKSADLDNFSSALDKFLKNKSPIVQAKDYSTLKKYASLRNSRKEKSNQSSISLIASESIDALKDCDYFRTDGGSLWKFTAESYNALVDRYQQYIDLGLQVYFFTSADDSEQASVFEGMVALGEEYPFSDGAIFADCIQNEITPVLVLEKESKDNIKLALNCGIAKGMDDIVLASALSASNQSIADISLDAKVYIGFGKSGTRELIKRFNDSGKQVLPIIKELADKSAILPAHIYATLSGFSEGCIKYTSSLSLRNADSEKKQGGVKDALINIVNARLAHLKLNVFKRYLTFATVFRISLAVLSLLSNSSYRAMSALMILLSGLLSDSVALLAVKAAKEGAPSPKKNYERIPVILYAISGILVALASHITLKILLSGDFIPINTARMTQFYLSLFTQFIAVGAFLLTLNNKVSKYNFNFQYFFVLMAYSFYLVIQSTLPEEIFVALESLSCTKIELKILPVLFFPAILAFLLIFLIGKYSRKFFHN